MRTEARPAKGLLLRTLAVCVLPLCLFIVGAHSVTAQGLTAADKSLEAATTPATSNGYLRTAPSGGYVSIYTQNQPSTASEQTSALSQQSGNVNAPGISGSLADSNDIDVTLLIAIGWISTDGAEQYHIGFIRVESLGQTYSVVRHEGDGRIVRRWIPPYSPMVHVLPWDIIFAQFTFSVEVVTTIPLDHRMPEPHMLARRFDGDDDRIFAYDAELQQWRHIPDYATFQHMGFYWCNVNAADSKFFDRITPGPPYPASGTPELEDYPNCQT